MKNILKVVTGSQLHGLANEKSDTDYRGVFMEDLMTILSPYRKAPSTRWVEGTEDDTSYELGNFCRMCAEGNPSSLEVLWSNMIEECDEVGQALMDNREKFLNSDRIFEAHRGYAFNQYKKMNLFEPDNRTPKFAVAYVRSLQQGIQLLKDGTFSPQIIRDKEFLLEMKNGFDPKVHPQALGILFSKLQQELVEAHAKSRKFTPDIDWIEEFIFNSYTQ